MIFQTVVSNKAHPEYGQATISFPIPGDQYDQTIELLEGLAIGSPTGQDCRVDFLDSKYPILKRLVTQSINLDELDYLAKRLESFCTDEDAEFQAMAFKFCLSDIKDFINLTFCCQQATVITDFANLEQAGKSHSLTINGGTMPMEEFDRVDGLAVALDLIQSGAEMEKLEAVVLMAQPTEAGEIRQLAKNLDQFSFVPGVESPERNSQLNELGYVAYHGSLTLEKLMREDPAEQYQHEMGGLA